MTELETLLIGSLERLTSGLLRREAQWEEHLHAVEHGLTEYEKESRNLAGQVSALASQLNQLHAQVERLESVLTKLSDISKRAR